MIEAQENLLPHKRRDLGPAKKTAFSGPNAGSGGNLRFWIVLIAVWLIAAAYAGSYLKRGWVPHDEGAFAQSADRVLHGELPHRDYTEIYTGGLAFLHAFAFRHLGESFATLRIVLFLFFVIWVPVFYWIASRLVLDWIAGFVTLLAVVWSLPNYSAAVPSWYNLFFATFSLAALFAWFRTRTYGWLFLAGLLAGCSFLAKATALFYVAAVLLFFLFSEQCETFSPDQPVKTRSPFYSVLVILSMFFFQAGLAFLIRESGHLEEFINLVLPPAVLATLILIRETTVGSRTSGDRFKTLLRMVLPFGLGFLAPLAVFAIPFVRGNALHAALTGIFLLPFRRVSGAYAAPPELINIVQSLTLVAILFLGSRVRGIGRWLVSLGAGALVVYYFIGSAREWHLHQRMWYAAYWLTPLLAVTGALVIRSKRSDPEAPAHSFERQKLFLVLAVLVLCNLVQYPFAAPIYFCYVAPLVILGAVVVLRSFPSIPRPLLAVLFCGFLFFAIFRVTPPFIYSMGNQYLPDTQTEVLDLPRAGGLRVDPESVDVYQELIPLIQEHAGSGEIYAAPDCPEVYFLAGYKNPTRALFDFFEDDSRDREHILRLLDARRVRVIVLNRIPAFSPPLPPDLRQILLGRFPNAAVIRNFEVMWRE